MTLRSIPNHHHHHYRSGGFLSEARALLGRGAAGGDDGWVPGAYLELLQALAREKRQGAALAVWGEMRAKV